jgi:hypothetical protein
MRRGNARPQIATGKEETAGEEGERNIASVASRPATSNGMVRMTLPIAISIRACGRRLASQSAT